MSIDQSERRTRPSNEVRFDDRGRIIPMTDAERGAYIESALAGIKALAQMTGDDPPGATDIEFWKAMDEERPERPLFKDLY